MSVAMSRAKKIAPRPRMAPQRKMSAKGSHPCSVASFQSCPSITFPHLPSSNSTVSIDSSTLSNVTLFIDGSLIALLIRDPHQQRQTTEI